MTPTEIALLAVYKTPVIRLDAICDQYLNNAYDQARRKAHLHTLPFPAFQLDDSKKAPWMVRISDFAAFLDGKGDAAATEWKQSQL